MGTHSSKHADGSTHNAPNETDETDTSRSQEPVQVQSVVVEWSTLTELVEVYSGDDSSPRFIYDDNKSDDDTEPDSATNTRTASRADSSASEGEETRRSDGMPVIIVQAKCGEATWQVRRSFRDLSRLSSSIGRSQDIISKRRLRKLRESQYPMLATKIHTYLNEAFSDLTTTRRKALAMNFLRISRSSFDPKMEFVYFEGCFDHVLVHREHRSMACRPIKLALESHWFVVRESCIMAFRRRDDAEPEHVLLLDDGLQYSVSQSTPAVCGDQFACMPSSGVQFVHVNLQTRKGTLSLRTRDPLLAADLVVALRRVKDTSPYVRSKHLGSYAPVRGNTMMKWLVDGRNAYADMVDAVLTAKREIFITGWWVTPEIPMIRDKDHIARLVAQFGPEILARTGEEEDTRQAHSDAEREEDEWSRRALRAVAEPLIGGELGGTAVDTNMQSREGEEGTGERVPRKDAKDHGAVITLRQLLKFVAARGVEIYIQMWKEPPFSLAISSAYQKSLLKAIGPNVHVMRHGSVFWTHHEKLLIIDRQMAFIGGIDVAWCRYDTGGHILEDPEYKYFRHGLEYYNPAFSDWVKVEDIWNDRFDRSLHPRMPWHDVHSCLRGPPAQDLARHFIQRWNFSRLDKNKVYVPVLYPRRVTRLPNQARADTQQPAANRTAPLVRQPSVQTLPPGLKWTDYCAIDWAKHWFKCDVQVLRSAGSWSAGQTTESSIFRGYVHTILHAKHCIYMENQYFLSSLGWEAEDLAMMEDADTNAEMHRTSAPKEAPAPAHMKLSSVVSATTAAKAGAGDSNPPSAGKLRWLKARDMVKPNATEQPQAPAQPASRWSKVKASMGHGDELHSLLAPQNQPATAAETPGVNPTATVPAKVVATEQPTKGADKFAKLAASAFAAKKGSSLSALNTEAKPTQPSYIRTTPPGREVLKWSPVESSIAEALFVRLCKAIDNNEKFRVIVVIPVHPDGPIRTMRAVQLVLLWQTRTIGQGKLSILHRLREKYPHIDVNDYIVFCALRNHGVLSGVTVTEQVYVHSKVLIADDRVAIIGSANANDRSQYGDRDSECAVIITGGESMETRMAGKPWVATAFAHTLRRNLWEEHLEVGHSCVIRSAGGTPKAVPVHTHDNAHYPWAPMRQQIPAHQHGRKLSGTHTSLLLKLDSGDHLRDGGSTMPLQAETNHKPHLQLPPDTADVAATAAATTATLSAAEITSNTATSQVKESSFSTRKKPSEKKEDIRYAFVKPLETSAGTMHHELASRRDSILQSVAQHSRDCACDALVDPCVDSVYRDIWLKTAFLNTDIYNSVFPGIIQDSIKTLDEWEERDKMPPRNEELLQLTLGKLVLWPTQFLENEDLRTTATEKEHYLPTKVVQ